MPREFGGPGFRCAAWLRDGTYLPCVFVQPIGPYADRKRELIEAETRGEGSHALYPDPLREFIKRDSSSNRVADYNIERIEPSRFAIPISLLAEVHGETAMSLWLFALETASGRRLSFMGGHLAYMMFFDLPDDLEFSDFVNVRNVDSNKRLPKCEANFRARMFFDCFTDNEPPAQADLSRIGLE
ncbi:MAG: hypothetical protein R3C27_11445 [Hyphomonadaceae bacterium]